MGAGLPADPRAAAQEGRGRRPRARVGLSALPLHRALLLGLLQGPAELLPVSSSGHLALVPRLLGWDYADLPADARKTFEVALHAGSAPALALALRGGVVRDPHLQALTFLPPALIGLAFERPIERRLGGAALGGGRAGARRAPR